MSTQNDSWQKKTETPLESIIYTVNFFYSLLSKESPRFLTFYTWSVQLLENQQTYRYVHLTVSLCVDTCNLHVFTETEEWL